LDTLGSLGRSKLRHYKAKCKNKSRAKRKNPLGLLRQRADECFVAKTYAQIIGRGAWP
jgi:hypothetical protein